MPQKATRVYGPYFDSNRSLYRLFIVEGDRKKSVSAASEEAALRLKEEVERALLEHAGLTVEDAIESFLSAKRQQGLQERSLNTIDYKLRYFLPLEESIRSITPARALALYVAETERTSRYGRPVEAQTHQSVLRVCKLFFRWLVDKGHLDSSPFEKVKPLGKANAGKQQLRIDEARRLVSLLVEEAEKGEEGATACLCQLLLGLRSSEVLGRHVRDLDDGAHVLWIPRGKTKNARRRLMVPETLRPFLLRLARGKGSESLLFGGDRTQPHFHMWLWRQLQKYCKRAGLPRVCPHSLRGLHSSLAIAAGSTPGVVASALGHGSFSITAKHYVDPDTLANSTVSRVTGALALIGAAAPEDPPGDPPGDPIDRLRTLPREKLAALLALLDGMNLIKP